MKKTLLLINVIGLLIFTNCKQEKTEIITQEKTENVKTFSVLGETSVVKWTAYKTTDKVAVNGKFNTIKITNSKQAKTVEEALNGILFSIPVSSIITKDVTRDSKLKEFFFGVMNNTEFITGTFDINNTNNIVNITMNGVTKSLPIDLKIDGQKATFTNTINLNDWNLKPALDALNKACFNLHKGPDGISKTWDEVEISAVIYLKVNN